MAKMVKVELVCKAENKVVADIETDGPIDQKQIRAAKIRSRKRMPPRGIILTAVQMTCAHCHEALYFRAAEGEMIPALPGATTAQP